MLRFILTFVFLVISGSSYVGLRITEVTWHWFALSLITASILLFPIMVVTARHTPRSLPRFVLQQLTYISMGELSFLVVVTALRDLSLLAVMTTASPQARSWWTEASTGTNAFAAATLVTVIAMIIAFTGPRVKNVTIAIRNIPQELAGFRLAQISDLHIGNFIGARYVARVVKLVNSLQPNLTVLTGDIIDGPVDELKTTVAKLQKLLPINKIYYVPGNHEYYLDFPAWMDQLRSLGIHALLNRGEFYPDGSKTLWIGGITDPAALASVQNGGNPDVTASLQGSTDAAIKILLSHRPDYADEAEKAGYHLQLSGHTHGGQFFPWTHLFKLAHRFYVGLLKHREMWVYVNPGTGFWGPPLRFGTVPEITCITLQPLSS